MLVLASLPMAVIALLVRRRIGAPVLFSQPRLGLQGNVFVLYKFRTMTDVRDESGRLLSDDARLPRLGRFLRRSSLDELPEVFNVLNGDMSLVGPRPLLPQYLSRYTPEQARRHEVKPGITGWAQVNGRNALTWEGKFALDVWYVDHWSMELDLKVLGMTIVHVLKGTGVSAEDHATMPEFMGTLPDEDHRG